MAGAPTKSECIAMLKAGVDMLETARANGDTLIGTTGKVDVYEQALEGDFAPVEGASAASAYRSALAAAASRRMAQSILLPIAREIGRLAGSVHWNTGNVAGLVRDVARYFHDQSPIDTVNSRDITYGSASLSGSNAGTGSGHIISVDALGYDIENVQPEVVTLECIQDQGNGGRRHEEMFRIRGEDPGLDALDVTGSGLSGTIPSRHAGTNPGTGSMLRNGSFQTYSASATPKFTSWVQTSGGANVSQNTAAHYRGFPGNTDTHSLSFAGNAVLTQSLGDRLARMNDAGPYYYGVAYNREVGSGTGTLRIRLGTRTNTIALSAQTGWGILAIALDQNSWLSRFNEDSLDATVEVESYSAGYILVDDAILAQLTPFGGLHYMVRGGATPWRAAWTTLPFGDTMSFTHTGGSPATYKVQYWWWRAFGTYLGSATAAGETITDP